jgi:hypothetical protein
VKTSNLTSYPFGLNVIGSPCLVVNDVQNGSSLDSP